jgi:hypothetical protein
MTKYILILIIVSLNINLHSEELSRQKLNKLYNDFIESRTIIEKINTGQENKHIKCNFGLINSVRMHFNSFTPQQ